ncbi:hypothetical protein [Micromonospora craniellae]|uniref:hypothetical protein n=1 Tax=Micromonospora craniellae TaxID=2294034 RepID=UPI0013141E5D|nr:hypothetical protein [Micromonospora craniellae]QOC90112.1 hypothetical protein ID554_18080 [Micromonospora craniellae]
MTSSGETGDRPQIWQERLYRVLPLYVGLLGFAATLVIASPWYGFFAWVGFVYAFFLPGRWPMAGVAVTAALLGTSQSGGLPSLSSNWLVWLVMVSFNLIVAGGVSWFAFVAEREGEKSKRLVAELTDANARLAETVRENEGLHAQRPSSPGTARPTGTGTWRTRWTWPGRASPRHAGRCGRSARSRWRRPDCPTRSPSWAGAGRPGTGWPPASTPPVRPARCTRRSR